MAMCMIDDFESATPRLATGDGPPAAPSLPCGRVGAVCGVAAGEELQDAVRFRALLAEITAECEHASAAVMSVCAKVAHLGNNRAHAHEAECVKLACQLPAGHTTLLDTAPAAAGEGEGPLKPMAQSWVDVGTGPQKNLLRPSPAASETAKVSEASVEFVGGPDAITLPGSVPPPHADTCDAPAPEGLAPTTSVADIDIDNGVSVVTIDTVVTPRVGTPGHEKYVIRKQYDPTKSGRRTAQKHRTLDGNLSLMSVHRELDTVMARVEMHDGFLKHVISFPGDRRRLVWDLMGAALIFYDIAAIPISAFSPPKTSFTEGVDLFALIFWTMNVFMSMQVGFLSEGVTVMVPHRIVIHYLKTWFLVDMVVVVPDWFFLMAGSSSNGGLRLLRIARIFRCLRLLRLMKLGWIVQMLTDRLPSEHASIMFNIVKMIILLLIVNHFIAAIWYLLGVAADEAEGISWLSQYGVIDENWFLQYSYAFHWSITQFTPASMHVNPQTLRERMFNISVVVFALVGFSYIVGSITGSLTQLRAMKEQAAKQMWQVRRYLTCHNVSVTLSIRIQRYLDYAIEKSKRTLRIEQIALFSSLSEDLFQQLQCELALPGMAAHPIFQHLHAHHLPTMHRAATTISHKSIAHGDSLFYKDETATHLYFVRSGRLQYIQGKSSMQDTLMGPLGARSANAGNSVTREESCTSGQARSIEWVDSMEDWIAEPVLWTPTWVHRGMLHAAMECELLLVKPDKFAEVVTLNPAVYHLMCGYAALYLKWVNARSFVSDISQGEDVSSTIKEMIHEASGGELYRAGFRRARTTSMKIFTPDV